MGEDYLENYSPDSPYILDQLGNKVFKVDPAGNQNVVTQDQHTDPIIIYFNQVTNNTILADPVVLDSITIEVVSAVGISAGKYLTIFDATIQRFSTFFITAVLNETVTLDSPMDVAYPAGSAVDIATVDLNVNGSVTPVKFGLRGTTEPPDSVPIKFDVTRIMIQCVTGTAVSFGLFGDQPILTNGLVFRKRDGRFKNIFNFKSNDEMANTMFDWDILSASNPSQGVDGFKGRLTFAGQSKIGVTVRLGPGEDGELWVQDDLQLITRLRIIAEGHIVE